MADPAGDGLVVGADGLARCAWATSAPEYVAYHDQEWGRPVHGEQPLFERLCLEAFQSGLSWITILRKRPAFRSAFCGFDPVRVAAFGPDDVARLMADASIVRNSAKIRSVISNARAVLDLRTSVDGGLDALVWAHAPGTGRAGRQDRPARPAAVPASTPESVALAAELRRRDFTFVGPITAYAAMQACGLVDDHLAGCCVDVASASAGPVGTGGGQDR